MSRRALFQAIYLQHLPTNLPLQALMITDLPYLALRPLNLHHLPPPLLQIIKDRLRLLLQTLLRAIRHQSWTLDLPHKAPPPLVQRPSLNKAQPRTATHSPLPHQLIALRAQTNKYSLHRVMRVRPLPHLHLQTWKLPLKALTRLSNQPQPLQTRAAKNS